MSTGTASRKPVARRTGHAIAAVVNVVLLYLINARPGWEVVPLFTADMTRALPLINLSLMAGVVVNMVYLAYDRAWLVAAGGVVTTGIGLAALARLWQVFPFDLAGSPGWSATVRVLLLLAMAGSVIGLIVQLVTLARVAAGRDGPR